MSHKLKLDDLEVTSFSASPEALKERGTVKGHETYASCNWTDYFECTCGSDDSYDTFCPSGGGGGTDRPGDSCRSSCMNYTCEGATCRYVIC